MRVYGFGVTCEIDEGKTITACMGRVEMASRPQVEAEELGS
jgi:hypothetical protein